MKKKSDNEVEKAQPQPPRKPTKQNPPAEDAQRGEKPKGVKGWLLRWINRLINKYSKFN